MKNNSPIKFNNVIDAYIIFTIFFFTILIIALSSLSELFTYGFLKKEILCAHLEETLTRVGLF